MLRFLVIFYCFLLFVQSQQQNNEFKKIKLLFDKVIKNQLQIHGMLGSTIDMQQQQNTKQLQKFLPETEKLLHDVLQSYRKLTISMRDQFQNAANNLQPLISEEYDIQQLEFQTYVRNFLQEVLDGINYHTKHCLAQSTAKLGSSSNQCEQQEQWPDNCKDVESKRDGVTRIYFQKKSFLVFCDQKTREGGWMVVLQRSSAEKNFLNTWVLHENGFGTYCEPDFFIGLRALHKLTAARKHELLIEVRDEKKILAYALYDEIRIGDEHTGYQFMVLGNYSGTAGDSMRYVVGKKFATIEHDIDECVLKYNATGWLMGGTECSIGNIFGNILKDTTYHKQSALVWPSFRALSLLKEVRMLIRVV